MRLPRLLLPFLLLSLLLFLGVRIHGFVQLFFEHQGIAVTQQEIKQAYENDKANNVTREEHIPRIIHQVFHNWRDPGNETIPSDWDEVRKGCQDKNPGWEYHLWTESSSRKFIEENYPWFLKTYDGYRFPVQRVDSVRYFLLLKFGGIYLDLDNGCLTSLDALLTYPTFLTDGGRGALSNNILASRPNHPFWALLTSSLIPYNYNYFFPYVTISYASGQWFETAIWEKYHRLLKQGNIGDGDGREGKGGGELHRVMMDDRDGKREEWVYFTQERGGTWVNWDNYFFLWVGDHLLLEGVVVLGLVVGMWWVAVRCCFGKGRGRGGRAGARGRYVGVKVVEGDV